jgi:hypothetical protein
VCNDGTRSGYFYKQSTAQATQFDWFFFLQGGDWCYSQETCDTVRSRDASACVARRAGALTRALPPQRANNTAIYMSSQAWPWEITLGGAARGAQLNGSVGAATTPAPAAAPALRLGRAPLRRAAARRPAGRTAQCGFGAERRAAPRHRAPGSLSECAPFSAGAFDADPTKSPWATYNKGALSWR